MTDEQLESGLTIFGEALEEVLAEDLPVASKAS